MSSIRRFVAAGMITCSLTSALAASDVELAALVAQDLREPVRPGGVNGQAFWNMNALTFMYPPSFDLPKTEGADYYRFRVIGSDGKMREFNAAEPTATLVPIWDDLPVGRAELWMEATAGKKHYCIRRSRISFWKSVAYQPGTYPPAPRSYAEAARLGYGYLLSLPHIKNFIATGKPDHSYGHNCYPSKMHAAVVSAMVKCAQTHPDLRETAFKLAHVAADYLISVSQPDDAPLAGFPPTYQGDYAMARWYAGQVMLVYPANVGSAYLDLYGLTRNERYLVAARKIAETYLRLQGEDGTWYLKMWEKDGKPVNSNRLHPCSVLDFMDAMYAATGDVRYRDCADRVFGFFERGPLQDWNWEGQFEDIPPVPFKYANMTMHPAGSVAVRICHRWPKDKKRIAQARELLRYAEDQFVYWQKPFAKERIDLLREGKWTEWLVEPAVVEQYHYRMPVDSSAAKLVQMYLALYKVTGNPLDLAKARTLGDAIVRTQQPNGRIPTLWTKRGIDNTQRDWINCFLYTLDVLEQLAAVSAED